MLAAWLTEAIIASHIDALRLGKVSTEDTRTWPTLSTLFEGTLPKIFTPVHIAAVLGSRSNEVTALAAMGPMLHERFNDMSCCRTHTDSIHQSLWSSLLFPSHSHGTVITPVAHSVHFLR